MSVAPAGIYQGRVEVHQVATARGPGEAKQVFKNLQNVKTSMEKLHFEQFLIFENSIFAKIVKNI